MNGVGIDTASFLLPLSGAAAEHIASRLPYQRRSRVSVHHYGAFADWGVTLHRASADTYAAGTLVVTASLPRLLYGENTRAVGTVGASEAVTRLRDRIHDCLGLYVDMSSSTICRVDFCATIAPYPGTQTLLAALAGVHLSRRQRAVMDNGVAFFTADTKTTIYDKRAEVALARRRAVRRSSDPDHARLVLALIHADRRLRCGAVRVECRLNGARRIVRRLRLDRRAEPHSVLTTANAGAVVGAAVSELERHVRRVPAIDAAAMLSHRLGSVPASRTFALLVLADRVGSMEAAADALGIPLTAARRLQTSALAAGIGSVVIDASSESVLAFPPISMAWTDRFERRTQRIWHGRPDRISQHSLNFSLNSAA